MVPLHEIASVSEMQDFDKRRDSSDHFPHIMDIRGSESQKSFSPQTTQKSFHSVQEDDNSSFRIRERVKYLEAQFETFVQIKTIPNGFNSGWTVGPFTTA